MPRWSLHDYQSYSRAARNALNRQADREADLHAAITKECDARGWIALHSRMDKATTCGIGSPDFVIMAERGRVIIIEAKSATGKLSLAQQALQAWAAKLGHTIHVVRSVKDWEQIINPQQ